MSRSPRRSTLYSRLSSEQRWWFNTTIIDEEQCWIWKGRPTGSGYGSLRVDGKSVPAHRFGYTMLVGPIPKGLQIDHLCRNRMCVNPLHLEPVTSKENTHRGMGPAGIAFRMKNCKNGHPLVDDNLYINPTTGKRRCRKCNKAVCKSWKEANNLDSTGRLIRPLVET